MQRRIHTRPQDSVAAPVEVLAGDGVRLTVDATAGPRITSLHGVDGAELLALLDPPELVGPDDGPRTALHGGHRLWVAPEVPDVTYQLDDGAARIVEIAGGVAAIDDGRPLARELAVRLDGGVACLRHTVSNQSDEVMTIGPWALTQVKPGGTAVLPVGHSRRDPHGLQATGAVMTWPYTDLSDDRYTFHAQCITVEGRSRTREADPTKIGVDGYVPWVAYAIGASLLIIVRRPRPNEGRFADLGATTQVFTQRRFTELEVLAPLLALGPGDNAVLEQIWVVEVNPSPADRPDVEAIVSAANRAAATAFV